MELAGGHGEQTAEPTVTMNAQCLMMLATIRVASCTRITFLTIDVRLHGTPIARFNIFNTLTDSHNFDAQLVPGNSGITEEWHFS
jgi:hypothetical protein